MANSRHLRAVVEFEDCYLGRVMSINGDGDEREGGLRVRVRILRVQEGRGVLHIWVLVRGNKGALRLLQRRLANNKSVSYTILSSGQNTRLLYIVVPAVACPRRLVCPLASPSARAFTHSAAVEDGRVLAVVHVASKKALEELEEHGFRVLHVEEDDGYADLTPQQERMLLTAYEMGYYSYPRKASLKDLAEALGLSVSTVAERLRKAEIKVMERFVKEELVLLKFLRGQGDGSSPRPRP